MRVFINYTIKLIFVRGSELTNYLFINEGLSYIRISPNRFDKQKN